MSGVESNELVGGTINRPVRIGDTVRRPSGPWSENVRHLLTHLQDVGFGYAPKFLGFDEEGREILSYVPGRALMRPWPSAFREVQALRDVARVVRLYHDAVADYRPQEGRPWFNGRTEPLPGEIIIHGDLGPWNIIIDDSGKVTGIIDWDFAQPGHATSDIAYLAFYLTMLRDDEAAASAGFTSPPDRRARLEALATAYGIDPISVASEAYRIEFDRRCRIRVLGPTGQEPWAGFLARGMDKEIDVDLTWLTDHINDVL